MEAKVMVCKTEKVIGRSARRSRKPAAGADINIALATTESPLDYMLRVMRDPSQDDARRDAMAKAALPYVHARLTSTDGQLSENEGGPISFTWKPPQT